MRSRQPSDRFQAWAHWRGAIAGERQSIQSEPRCGFYMLKRFSRSLAVSIDLEQEIAADTGELIADERLVCLVDGVREDPDAAWLQCALYPITEEHFHRLRRAPVTTDLTRQVVV